VNVESFMGSAYSSGKSHSVHHFSTSSKFCYLLDRDRMEMNTLNVKKKMWERKWRHSQLTIYYELIKSARTKFNNMLL
jgi:hypothetical protein